jgi:hypothetical protein
MRQLLSLKALFRALFLVVVAVSKKVDMRNVTAVCLETVGRSEMRAFQLIPGAPIFLHCPTAKAGSSTVGNILKTVLWKNSQLKGSAKRPSVDQLNDRGSVIYDETGEPLHFIYVKDLSLRHKKWLCSQPHISFTIVRNPWDRLISGFIGKVILDEKGMHAPRHFSQNPSFTKFLEYIVSQNPSTMDVHFTPTSQRCKPAVLNYTIVAQLESGINGNLETVFEFMGWNKSAIYIIDERRHMSTKAACNESEFCKTHFAPLLENHNPLEVRQAFFQPDLYPRLNHQFYVKYRNDIEPFGYNFGVEKLDKETKKLWTVKDELKDEAEEKEEERKEMEETQKRD